MSYLCRIGGCVTGILLVGLWCGSARAANVLTVPDLLFPNGKATLESTGEGTYVSLPSVVATWDNQAGNDPLTLTVTAQSAVLNGTSGGSGTKLIGTIEVKDFQNNWQPLANNVAIKVGENLANNGGTKTVEFRIKVSFNDSVTSETGAQFVTPGGSPLLWSIFNP